jgi:delta 1-pyrroline-5-carboxylate dehydrogenase
VFNVVTGDAPTVVEPWLGDSRVRALSFTGSTEIGKHLYRRSADTVKRLVLELGGHAPFLLFAEADLDQAVDEAIKAKFATTGQDCLGANRFLIERPVYAAFCTKFAERVKALTLGPGMEDRDLGPLMNEKAVAKQEEDAAFTAEHPDHNLFTFSVARSCAATLKDEPSLRRWTEVEDEREAAADANHGLYYPPTTLQQMTERWADDRIAADHRLAFAHQVQAHAAEVEEDLLGLAARFPNKQLAAFNRTTTGQLARRAAGKLNRAVRGR